MSFSGALGIALPELILAIGAMVLLVIGAFRGDRTTGTISAGSGVVLVAAAAAACFGPHGQAFAGGFIADQAAAFSKVAIYLMSAVAVFLGDRWLARIKGAKFEYPVLVVLAALPFIAYAILWFLFARGLPSAESLLAYEPALPTYVRDINGAPVQSFARERRNDGETVE